MKILIVDDDPDLLAITGFALERAGFLVSKATDGEQGLDRFREEQPDLVILDINMPGIDGFELAKQIRESSNIPIIMLTVRDDEQDVVRALAIGADDHLAKPFSPKILVARIQALLRRVSTETSGSIKAGLLELDASQMTLAGVGNSTVPLTPLETRLLSLLFVNAGQPVHVEQILSHVWGNRADGNRQLLKQLVYRLRRKIEADPAAPVVLQTVPNAGYRLGKTSSIDT